MKSSRPFYLHSKIQHKHTVLIKNFVNSYFNNPHAKTPNVGQLNIIIKSRYDKHFKFRRKKSVNKKVNSNICKANKNNKSILLKRNLSLIRQEKYQQLFCSPNWNVENWNLFHDDSKSKISSLNSIQKKSYYINRLRLSSANPYEDPKFKIKRKNSNRELYIKSSSVSYHRKSISRPFSKAEKRYKFSIY